MGHLEDSIFLLNLPARFGIIDKVGASSCNVAALYERPRELKLFLQEIDSSTNFVDFEEKTQIGLFCRTAK